MEQKKKANIRAIFSITLIAIIAVVFGLWIQLHNRPAQATKRPKLTNGSVLTNAFAPKPFDLASTTGGRFSNAALRGTNHWGLLVFGFTKCKTTCPTTLTELKQATRLLTKTKNTIAPQVYFVSIDPERDTIPAIKRYLAHFNKNFIGATGSPDAIKAMTKNFGAAYAKTKSNNHAEYSIKHSGTVMLMDPKGHWLASINPPLNARAMAKDIALAQK